MTADQFEIADQFLKIIADNDGMINTDQYAPTLTDNGISIKNLFFVKEQLLASDIIRYVDGSDKYRIMFTQKGEKAQKIGLKMFLETEVVIEQYLEKKNRAIPWTQICLDLNISENNKTFILQQVVNSEKFILTEMSRGRLLIKNNKNMIPSKEKLHKDKFEIKANNLHIGDNFGTYNQTLSDNDLIKTTILPISPTLKPKSVIKSWLEIISWVTGIIGGFIALYEFWLKHYF